MDNHKRYRTSAVIYILVATVIGCFAGNFDNAHHWPSESYPYHGWDQAKSVVLATQERLSAMSWGDAHSVPFWFVSQHAAQFGWPVTPLGSVRWDLNFPAGPYLSEMTELSQYTAYLQWEILVDCKNVLKNYIIPNYVNTNVWQASGSLLSGFATAMVNDQLPYLTPTGLCAIVGCPPNYFDVTDYYALNVVSNGWKWMPAIFDQLVATGSRLAFPFTYQPCFPYSPLKGTNWVDYFTSNYGTLQGVNPIWTNTLEAMSGVTNGYGLYCTNMVEGFSEDVLAGGGADLGIIVTYYIPPLTAPGSGGMSGDYIDADAWLDTIQAWTPACYITNVTEDFPNMYATNMVATNYDEMCYNRAYYIPELLLLDTQFTEFTYALAYFLGDTTLPNPNYETLGNRVETNECWNNGAKTNWGCVKAGYVAAISNAYCWLPDSDNYSCPPDINLFAHWILKAHRDKTQGTCGAHYLKVADFGGQTTCTNLEKITEVYFKLSDNHVYDGQDLSPYGSWSYWGVSDLNYDPIDIVVTNVDLRAHIPAGTLEDSMLCETAVATNHCEYKKLGIDNRYGADFVNIEWIDLPVEVRTVRECVVTNCDTISPLVSFPSYDYTVTGTATWHSIDGLTEKAAGYVGYAFLYDGTLSLYTNCADTNYVGMVEVTPGPTLTYTNCYNSLGETGNVTVIWDNDWQINHYATSDVVFVQGSDPIIVGYEGMEVPMHYGITNIVSSNEYSITTSYDFVETMYPYSNDVTTVGVIVAIPSNDNPYACGPLYSVGISDSYVTNNSCDPITGCIGPTGAVTYSWTNGYCFNYFVTSYATNYFGGTNEICRNTDYTDGMGFPYGFKDTVNDGIDEIKYTYYNNSVGSGDKRASVEAEHAVMWWNTSTNGFKWMKDY